MLIMQKESQVKISCYDILNTILQLKFFLIFIKLNRTAYSDLLQNFVKIYKIYYPFQLQRDLSFYKNLKF